MKPPRRRTKAKPELPAPVDPRLIGYARVSTAEQSLAMQIDALRRAGVQEDDLYSEHVSAVAQKRPQLQMALTACRPGDVLVVWKLDRFARSLRDLLNKLYDLEAMGVGFRSLTDSIDTGTSSARLLLGVLGAIAQFERDLISDRTKAGVKRHIESGGKMGAPPKMTVEKFEEVERRLRLGHSVKDIAQDIGVKPPTIYAYYSGEMVSALRSEGPLKQKRKS